MAVRLLERTSETFTAIGNFFLEPTVTPEQAKKISEFQILRYKNLALVHGEEIEMYARRNDSELRDKAKRGLGGVEDTLDELTRVGPVVPMRLALPRIGRETPEEASVRAAAEREKLIQDLESAHFMANEVITQPIGNKLAKVAIDMWESTFAALDKLDLHGNKRRFYLKWKGYRSPGLFLR